MRPLLLLGVIAVVAVAIIYLVVYNRLVHGRQVAIAAWATVDTELQHRHELIPPLVETVRAAAVHEHALLEQLLRLNADAEAAPHDPATADRLEPELERAAAAVVALREHYPQLDASRNFLDLQQQLRTVEDRIAAARRYYNTKVRDYHSAREQFPGNRLAGRHGFDPLDYFGT